MCPLKINGGTAFLFALLLLVAQKCRAQLEWDSKELRMEAGVSDTEVVGHFKFRNVGSHEIKIKKVTTSCSCTVGKLEKTAYLPGEKGEVNITLKIGSRKGKQDKMFIVESNDPENPRSVLSMRVSIPEVAEVRP